MVTVDGTPQERQERIRRHYEIEVELAARLRQAERGERQRLYGELYDELFTRVPWHIQHRRRDDRRGREVTNARLRSFLSPWLTPTATVLEIGAGDGAFARELAAQVVRAYALDVSAKVTDGTGEPPNYEFLVSDGTSIPLPDGSVDLVFSNQLVEHIHPDDLSEHLIQVRRVLRRGGRYLAITPNRLSGPHDISGRFHDEPQGLHLREFACADLAEDLRRAGFEDIRQVIRISGRPVVLPVAVPAALEAAIRVLPRRWQRRVAARAPFVPEIDVGGGR
jgi:SAM-dependent methyltransferase